MAPLATAAAEEEVIVDFVLCGGAGPIEDSGGGPFEGDDNGSIAFVGKDVATKAITLPAKGVGVVEACGDVLPFPGTLLLLVCICCHDSEVDNGFFVGNIGTRDFVQTPC